MGAAPRAERVAATPLRVRSGMDASKIKERIAARCAARGAVLHSRQLDALIDVFVEEIAPIEARIAQVEAALARLAADRREEIRLTFEGMALSAGAPVAHSSDAARLPDHES